MFKRNIFRNTDAETPTSATPPETPSVKTAFPTELTIGEQVFKVDDTPELAKFRDGVALHAQNVVKAQLYPQVNAAKNKAAEAEATVRELLTTSTRISNAYQEEQRKHEEEQEALRRQIAEANNNSAGLLTDEALAKIGNIFDERLRNVMPSYVSPEDTARMVEEARSAAMAEPDVIPELIKGNTVEEIAESVRKSKIAYNAINGIATPVAPATPAQTPQALEQPIAPAQHVPTVLGDMSTADPTRPHITPELLAQVNAFQNSFNGGSTQQAQPVQQVPAAQPPQTVVAPVQEAPQPIPMRQVPTPTDFPDVASMSPEEYSRQHTEILQRVKNFVSTLGQQ